MKKFFSENKIILAILVAGLIVGGFVYLAQNQKAKEALRQTVVENPVQCANIPDLPDGAVKLATKIIDGDTFLIEGGYSVRILGVDADERDHPCYEAAKNRLEQLILNKEVKLEKGAEDKDQWCRYLRYVFVDNQNVSLQLLKEGLAVARLAVSETKYNQAITQAEKTAQENKIGCKWQAINSAQNPNPAQGSEKENNNLQPNTSLRWEKLTTPLTGLTVVDACGAENYYHKQIIVEGKIVGTYRSKTNTVFLNFGNAYPRQCFTGVIFSSDQYKFAQNPEKYYEQKTVRIKGEIEQYNGKPQIILKDPSQIEIGK